MLIARAAEARDVLPDALRERGAEVDVVALYETVAEKPAPEALERAGRRLRHLHLLLDRDQLPRGAGGVPDGFRVVSIGPVTSEAAVKGGLRVDVEAEQHDIDG